MSRDSSPVTPPDPERTLTTPLAPQATPTQRVPAVIGHYRVIRLLGEGGMGAVYEAEQENPRRTVALKVIRPGLACPQLLRRFEQEAQALGRLQHPGIAQIYEAGTADTGFGPQPYFAMEFIRGTTLRDYARERRLTARQSLELMAKVSEAVQHAHQRGLIHRDLKPGNIVVDETGQPKILDFGVARVTDGDDKTTRQTDMGQLVGTLAYMSPEQVLADPLELDTRSDVYALGVILYELLAGRLPYNINFAKLHEAVRTIRETDAAPLSSVQRIYRGDIETIVAKALEKDKTRRYDSAAGLAADIHRYLNDEPIVARPPSAAYQLQKFARRHKALVTGVAAVFAVLVAGVIASTWQAARATRAERTAIQERDLAADARQIATTQRDRAQASERTANEQRNRAVDAEKQALDQRNRAVAEKSRADTESATAKAVNDFLQSDLLAQASSSAQARPDNNPDPDLRVRTALDRAAERIPGKFGSQPLVEASIRQTVGSAYQDLGLYPQAERHLRRALELRQRALGQQHLDTARAMNALAETDLLQSKNEEAEELFKKALQVRRQTLGKDHPDTLLSLNNLGLLYMNEGKYPQAEPLFVEALRMQRIRLGGEHQDTLGTLSNLANLYDFEGKHAQAETLESEALEISRRTLGEEHPETLKSLNNLAAIYNHQGKSKQAESIFAKVLDVRRRVLGEEHPETLNAMSNLASIFRAQGKYSLAEPLDMKVLEIRRRVLGEEHPATLSAMANVAALYRDQGKYSQGVPLAVKVVEVRRRTQGEEHPATLASLGALGSLYAAQGDYVRAEPIYVKVLEIRRRVLGEEHPTTLISMNNLGALYRNQGKYAQAEPLMTQALEVSRRVRGEEHPDSLTAMSNLASLYLRKGDYAQAEPLYVKALEIRRRVLGAEHPSTALTLGNLGALYRDEGKLAQAEPILNQAIDIQRRVLGEEHPNTLLSMNNLAVLYRRQGRIEEAEQLFTKVADGRRRVLGLQHADTNASMLSLVGVRIEQKKYPESEAMAREIAAYYQKAAPGNWLRPYSQTLLGASLAGQKNYAEAEPLLAAGYQGLVDRKASLPVEYRTVPEQTAARLVELYKDWGKPEKASEWAQKLSNRPASEP